jgi:hypothetical protein
MKKVYIVQVQGWGDDEDEFYNFGTYSTQALAEAKIEELLQGWEADGNDRDDVVTDVEVMTLDA